MFRRARAISRSAREKREGEEKKEKSARARSAKAMSSTQKPENAFWPIFSSEHLCNGCGEIMRCKERRREEPPSTDKGKTRNCTDAVVSKVINSKGGDKRKKGEGKPHLDYETLQ